MVKKRDQSTIQASFNIIRVGHNYRLINYGDEYIFEVLEIINNEECVVRSLDTLETYHLSDLVLYGKSADFTFEEI